jgi:hypothetical protein
MQLNQIGKHTVLKCCVLKGVFEDWLLISTCSPYVGQQVLSELMSRLYARVCDSAENVLQQW